MKAKFAGRCADCGGNIYEGSEIYWEKGHGATHAHREVCDSYDVQRAEMAMEEAFERRITGTWMYD
jgi:hypothetical protein